MEKTKIIDKNNNLIDKKDGFLCGIIGSEKLYHRYTSDNLAINETIDNYKKLLKNNQYVRITYTENNIIIDIVKYYTNKQDAQKNGIKNKQTSIFNIKKQKNIELLQKIFVLYKYNKIKNDIFYIKEYLNTEEMTEDLNKSYRTLKNYIIKSIDQPIKELLQDQFLIVQDSDYIINLIED